MTKIDDGGSAFPQPWTNRIDAATGYQTGMTLRQWFAGQAMAGLLASGVFRTLSLHLSPSGERPEEAEAAKIAARVVSAIAGTSYEVADAMLAERAEAADR